MNTALKQMSILVVSLILAVIGFFSSLSLPKLLEILRDC